MMAKNRNPLDDTFRNAQMAKLAAAWSAADADQDGLLNPAEWRVYVDSSRKTRAEEGQFVGAAPMYDEFYN